MSCFLVNWLSARATLGVMAFFMFLVTQMIRVNLYIAVVAINEKLRGNGTENETYKTTWNDNTLSLFLGAFYWSYWVTELPGGLLAQRYGGKKVMGLGVTFAAILNLLLPLACKYHYLLASLFRALQGLSLGVTWPVMHWLSARWIPQTERSKFMTSYQGASIGSAITFPLSGFIITYYEWETVFYFTGLLTLVWCFAWWVLVFDSPQQHPRLSESESSYLKQSIGDSVTVNNKVKKITTPWRDILYSKSFWAVFVASQGVMWGSITLSMQTPVYFYDLHRFDIKSTGLLSGIPEVSKFLFALLFSTIIDKIISKKVLSVTSARKLAVAVSEYIPGSFLILLGLFGCSDTLLATTLLTCACLMGGASSSGNLANVVDLSPNHAGTLLGIIKTSIIIPGVLSPLMVTRFTVGSTENKSSQWRNVFFFVAAIYIVTCTIYITFGSGKVQPWNQEQVKFRENVEFLKTNKIDDKIPAKTKGKEEDEEEEESQKTLP